MKMPAEDISEEDTRTISGRTPLIAAAQNGHSNAVRLLLKGGARPNIWAQASATSGIIATPVIMALQAGHAKCLELLLQNGADWKESERHSGTLVHSAAEDARLDCLHALVAAGIDVNVAKAWDGVGGSSNTATGTITIKTPLEIATAGNHTQIMMLLRNAPQAQVCRDQLRAHIEAGDVSAAQRLGLQYHVQ